MMQVAGAPTKGTRLFGKETLQPLHVYIGIASRLVWRFVAFTNH